jgi:twinkle protein
MGAVITEDDIDFEAYMRETDPQAKMRAASLYMDDVASYLADGPTIRGTPMPWEKTEDNVRFRPGEVSLWAGVNGHGKSLMQGFVNLGFMAANEAVVIASFEMRPVATLARMCRQASMGGKPTRNFVRMFGDWTDGRLWLYDHQGMIDPAHMMAVCRYSAEKIGAKHIVIDSLMKVVRGEDNYNAQKDFLDELCAFSRDTGVHVHLVHHMRKGGDEDRPGGKFDLKGSGSITDQADNVFIVWRNKKKQFDRQAHKEVDESHPDALLIVEKQRHGEWEGKIALWFDPASMQYLGGSEDHPIAFLPSAWRVAA